MGFTPLDDLGAGTHEGFQGGLYPGGSSERPASHAELGTRLARLAVPRNAAGVPDAATGKLVFLSIGMSNTRNEFAQFVPIATADPLKHPRVEAINGAIGGMPAEEISNPASPYWAQVDQILAQNQATPLQVQAVWLKQANRQPTQPFPDNARRLQGDLEAIVQILKVRFPNLWLAYVSSRIYAGYATTTLNPEPHAYESGFAVKWLIERQLQGTFPVLGSARGAVAPWLAWGPYLWADGLVPRSDGLIWECADFAQDGTHPSVQGSQRVATMLLDFAHTDPTAQMWYRYAGMPPA